MLFIFFFMSASVFLNFKNKYVLLFNKKKTSNKLKKHVLDKELIPKIYNKLQIKERKDNTLFSPKFI